MGLLQQNKQKFYLKTESNRVLKGAFMNFAEAAKNEAKKTFTENGATAFNTSSDALVDLFGTIGALREVDETRITRLFDEAYKVDPLIATKILFYARDIRE